MKLSKPAYFVRAFLAALTLWSCACGDATTFGHLSIVVGARAGVRAKARELVVKTPSGEQSFDVSASDAWPTAFTLYGKAGRRGVIELWAKDASGPIVKRTLSLTFPSGRKALNVLLNDLCLGPFACESDAETCGDCGLCVGKGVDASRLMSVASEPDALADYRDPPCKPGDGSLDGGDVENMDASTDGSIRMPMRDGAMEGGIVGELDGSLEAAVPDASAPFRMSGPSVVAVGTCAPVDLQRTLGVENAANVDLEVRGGRLYSTKTCDNEIAGASFGMGEEVTRIYFRQDAQGDSGVIGSAHIGGTLGDANAELDIEVRTRAVAVSRGSYFGCALLSDGQVQCVGRGVGGSTGKCCDLLDPLPAVVPVKASPSATMLADEYGTCFLEAGKLGCFGSPGFTPQGPADATGLFTSPVLANGVTHADLGISGGCAVKADHSMYCWGSNTAEQCKAEQAEVYDPTRVTRLDDEALTAGDNWVEECVANYVSLCARTKDGKVYCWGEGYTDTELVVPSGATRLAENFGYACAVVDHGTSDDDVVCWSDPPFKNIGGLPDGKVEHLAVADNAGCAAIDEKVYCWGANVAGGLGTGSDQKVVASAQWVADLPVGDVEGLALGYSQAPAMFALVDGLVYGWGLGLDGDLGIDERHAFVRSPTRVRQLDGLGIKKVAIGPQTSCALLAGGLARCWGQGLGAGLTQGLADADFSLMPTSPNTFESRNGFVQLLPSGGFALALRDNAGSRELYAWGSNNFLQLGTMLEISDGSPIARSSYEPTRSITAEGVGGKIVKVSSGAYDTSDGFGACALVDDGSISCWGTWPGTLGSLYTPHLAVAASDNPRDLSASCALFDHTVECWSDSTWARKTILTFPSGIESIDAEVSTVCGKKGSDVYCSFKGAAAKLTFSGAEEYAVGNDFACAVLSDGTVECAGANDFGQLGRPPLGGTLPKDKVPGLTAALKLAAGGAMACVEDNGQWKCWGGNRNGNMGVVPYVYTKPTLIAPWSQ